MAVGAAGVLVLLACVGGVVAVARFGANTSKAGANSTPSTTPSPAAIPLTAQAYQALLTEVDTAMAPAMQDLVAARNPIAVGKAATALYSAAKASYPKLKEVTPPKEAATAHDSFLQAFARFRTVADDTATAAGGRRVCVGSAAMPQIANAPATVDLRSAVQSLAAVDTASPFKVGAWIPGPTAEQTRHLANGIYVKKGTRNGYGQLKIDNKTGTADVSLSLVPSSSKATAFTVYVTAGAAFTVTGIKDNTYNVYLTSGVDWDPGAVGFSRDCDYNKFQDTMEFTSPGRQYTVWTITLKSTTGGNASTEEVNPDEFPQ